MFRYIGLAWDETNTASVATAARLSHALRVRPRWQAALLRPDLQVFSTGTTHAANSTYSLGHGIVLGKLFRRRDLGHAASMELTLSSEEASGILDSAGRRLVHNYWGRYVAFLRTPSGPYVLRDPSGTLPCFRLRHQGVTVIFSWLEDLLDIPLLPAPVVNWDCLRAHMVLGELGGHQTALQGVTQVLPGEAVRLVGDVHTPVLLWNAVDFARAATDEPPAQAATELRETVRSCAWSWASCYDSLLLRLSGGVDSSILLSCLARGSTLAQVTCLNYHSPGSDSDEREYARMAAAKSGQALIELARDSSFRLEGVLDVARTPAPMPYVGRIGTARTDAEMAAAHDAAALFTGAGGDQLFFEFRRWWPAADYLQVRGLDSGFVEAAMDAARLGKVSIWKTLRLAISQHASDTNRRLEPNKGLTLLCDADLLQAVQHQRHTHPALHTASDLPIGKLMHATQLMQPVSYYDPFEREAAPELVNPLLSQPVVELCLKLPTYVLTRGGRGRALARQAFAADLPTAIANRRSKGGMEDYLNAVLERGLDFARSILLDGELARRGILDRAKVEDALSGKPSSPCYIGEIHAHIAIEAWLSRWSAHRCQPAA